MDDAKGHWWEDALFKGKSAIEVLQDLAKPLNLSQGDIRHILSLYHSLLNFRRGRSRLHLLLASTFGYLSSPTSGRPLLPASRFLEVCQDLGYEINRKSLLTLTKPVNLKSLPIESAASLLESHHYALKKRFGLLDSTLDLAKWIAASVRLRVQGRTPSGVAAASLYLTSSDTTQKELADYFGITEVTLRNIVKAIAPSRDALRPLIARGAGTEDFRVESVDITKISDRWDGFHSAEPSTCSLCNQTIMEATYLTVAIALNGHEGTESKVLKICWRCVLCIH